MIANPASVHQQLITRLETVTVLSDDDKVQLSSLPLHIRHVAQNHNIVRPGEKSVSCCLIISGLACRYKFANGGKRQILSLHLPGDFPDLQSLHLDVMDHGVQALSVCEVAYIPHKAVEALIEASASVGRALARHAAVDASIFREWITNMGRREAMARVGHLFCEMHTRMRALGLGDGSSFVLDMTQSELADAAGLSVVHINRTLQQLRALRLIASKGSVHTILDAPGLERVSDFDAGYLHLRASYEPDSSRDGTSLRRTDAR
jgi:CRP-like cAMP-binding protein